MVQPPIENGVLVLSSGVVIAVGRWLDLAPHVTPRPVDLGEVAVLPGLINAHCHLDYTDMAELIPPVGSFADWIKSITVLKAAWGYADFARSWLRGARMLVEHGVTTVGDIEAVPELLPDVWEATPLRVFSFLEMTGVKNRVEPARLVSEVRALASSLRSERSRAWLSPHAPYSTTPELLRLTAELARAHGWRITTHVAESAEEFEMFRHARGPLHDWLARNARDMSDCGGCSPVRHLDRQGLLAENFLAVHANHLEAGEAALLAQREASVVHCPRSHAYFGHRPFPLGSLRKAGVNVCLGSDSLATTLRENAAPPELDMLAEMRCFQAHHPGVDPATILRLATLHGARALGFSGRLGQLSAGALADLALIPHAGSAEQVYEAFIHHAGPVEATMIGGQWAWSRKARRP